SKTDKSVVRACPGSGKTYSISAKFAYLMLNWDDKASGIAVISFTNVAWREIEKQLDSNFETQTPISYPHFLGTIDSFVNKFIFLPFGHLIMGCGCRPTLVGEPHGTWSGGKYYRYYNQYFDKASFNIDDEVIWTGSSQSIPFKWNKNDGTITNHVKNLEKVKLKYWQNGYATQDDANYIALKLLQQFPQIAKAIIYRFPQFIIDEAQDTSAIHMEIIDNLVLSGLEKIMLVGDPDQAIFEWNDAEPELFIEKFTKWRKNSIILNENRRSSRQICDFTYNLSSLENISKSVNPEVKDYDFTPTILTYNKNNLKPTIDNFLELCREHSISINETNVAIIYRSKNIYNQITEQDSRIHLKNPWITESRIAEELAKSKHMCENNQFKKGFKLIEKAFFKLINEVNF